MNLYNSLLIVLANFSFLKALKFGDSKSDILPSKNVCGFQHCEAFPWLVFIPLESRMRNPDVDLRCAGVLISKRYVITTMSCLQFALTKVHIGRFSTKKNVTCANRPVLSVEVEERAVDEVSEVALLRLAEDVEFGDDVRPICLPFDDLKRAEPGSEVFTSGWGFTAHRGERAKNMKKIHGTFVTNEDCPNRGIIQEAGDDTAMCIRQNPNQLDFICDGDEGSPIMYYNEEQWVLEGILSWLFDNNGESCAVRKPARGSRITEEVLQFIVDKVYA